MDQSWVNPLFGLMNWCSNPSTNFTGDDIDYELQIPPITSTLSYSIQLQKYLLGKLSNKYVAKFVINEIVNRILDNLHNLILGFSGNIETADNLKQWIIELLLKLQVLYYNDNVLSEDNLKFLKDFHEQFIALGKYMIELYEFNFILDRILLIRKCEQCQELMHKAVGNCLSRNSHARIDSIFNFISDEKFVKYVFNSKSAFNTATIKEIIVDLGLLVTEGII